MPVRITRRIIVTSTYSGFPGSVSNRTRVSGCVLGLKAAKYPLNIRRFP